MCLGACTCTDIVSAYKYVCRSEPGVMVQCSHSGLFVNVSESCLLLLLLFKLRHTHTHCIYIWNTFRVILELLFLSDYILYCFLSSASKCLLLALLIDMLYLGCFSAHSRIFHNIIVAMANLHPLTVSNVWVWGHTAYTT